jgi:hypothetical protein
MYAKEQTACHGDGHRQTTISFSDGGVSHERLFDADGKLREERFFYSDVEPTDICSEIRLYGNDGSLQQKILSSMSGSHIVKAKRVKTKRARTGRIRIVGARGIALLYQNAFHKLHTYQSAGSMQLAIIANQLSN